jgi:hypothetical protein
LSGNEHRLGGTSALPVLFDWKNASLYQLQWQETIGAGT